MITIDPATDSLIPVRKVCHDRLGKKVAPSTIWRWVHKGCRGVKLAAVSVGGVWHTTAAAWAEFINGQTAAAFAVTGDPKDSAEEAVDELPEHTIKALKAAGVL